MSVLTAFSSCFWKNLLILIRIGYIYFASNLPTYLSTARNDKVTPAIRFCGYQIAVLATMSTLESETLTLACSMDIAFAVDKRM